MVTRSVPNISGRLSSGVTMSAAGSAFRRGNHSFDAFQRLHQCLQFDVGLHTDLCAVRGEQRCITGELDHVAMSLFGDQQDALAGDLGELGDRGSGAGWIVVLDLPSPLVFPPTVFVSAEQQQDRTLVPFCDARIGGCDRVAFGARSS